MLLFTFHYWISYYNVKLSPHGSSLLFNKRIWNLAMCQIDVPSQDHVPQSPACMTSTDWTLNLKVWEASQRNMSWTDFSSHNVTLLRLTAWIILHSHFFLTLHIGYVGKFSQLHPHFLTSSAATRLWEATAISHRLMQKPNWTPLFMPCSYSLVHHRAQSDNFKMS